MQPQFTEDAAGHLKALHSGKSLGTDILVWRSALQEADAESCRPFTLVVPELGQREHSGTPRPTLAAGPLPPR